ncbi:MAG: DUF2694 domain-containing protein [Actinophytocola sp.]|nr:DUF2694 domain-containing protein [Actinophytocola sp.]
MSYQSSKDLIEGMRWQVQKIKNKQAENDELLGKLDRLRPQLSALEATATSPDGTVTVFAGAGGIVRSVQLTDAAMRSNASTLAAAINAAIEQAIGKATAMQLEIVRNGLGETIEPEAILGPQAKFAGFGRPAELQASADDAESGYDDADYDDQFGARFGSR